LEVFPIDANNERDLHYEIDKISTIIDYNSQSRGTTGRMICVGMARSVSVQKLGKKLDGYIRLPVDHSQQFWAMKNSNINNMPDGKF